MLVAGDTGLANHGLESGPQLRQAILIRSWWRSPRKCCALCRGGDIVVLLDELEAPAERGWYATAAVEYGWSPTS